MNIAENHVVRFHYTVHEEGGKQLESSRDRGQPMAVMIGHGGLIEGLEKALIGKAEGECFEITVPPAEGDPRPVFRALREAAERLELPALSMGMSGDLEAAIAEGATMVRVGTAIFGARG